jgi:regulatory protein
MIITEIREQKNGRFAIYADGEYVLSADASTIGLSTLKKGAEISVTELEAFARTAQDQFAKDKAFTFLSYRDHSKEELRRKLLRSVDEETADNAAQRMEDLGLVNDEAYAEKFARELLNTKLMGANRVVYEMTRRGLDRELTSETVERLDTEPEERIIRFVQKKYPRGISEEKDRRRALAALARNGFRWDEIREALRDYDEED